MSDAIPSRAAILDEVAAAFEEWFAPRDTPVYGELDPGPDYVMKNMTPLARLDDVLGVLDRLGRSEDTA